MNAEVMMDLGMYGDGRDYMSIDELEDLGIVETDLDEIEEIEMKVKSKVSRMLVRSGSRKVKHVTVVRKVNVRRDYTPTASSWIRINAVAETHEIHSTFYPDCVFALIWNNPRGWLDG